MIKEDILAMFKAAISAVEGRYVVKQSLPSIIKDQLSADEVSNLRIIAIGKAADAMLHGALDCLEDYLEKSREASSSPLSSLLITKTGHVSFKFQQNTRIHCMESAHPVPDESSLLAGQTLIDFLQTATNDTAPCLFLISGGTSSLVEVLADDWSLKELQELTQWMLANGCSIDQINAVRSRISKLKGGGLWQIINNKKKLKERKILCLMISDVPNDDPSVIGSGLLFPTKLAQPLPDFLPNKWKIKLSSLPTINPPTSFYWEIVASNNHARQAAANHANELGYQIKIIDDLLQGDVIKAAKHCIQSSQKKANTMFIWGAETTVTLPENPGKGGRNQHLALAAAIEISQSHDNQILLSAGTDGTDGLTEDTGAIVDNNTIKRAEREGFNAKDSLQGADSGHFLQASGDLISTGVTGTNVMDLVIAYCERSNKGIDKGHKG